jgi:excisionase family DNA binding protein
MSGGVDDSREPRMIDPYSEEAVDALLNDPWPDHPYLAAWEVREAATCERPPTSPPTLLVDTREAARMLGCSRSLIYEFISAKELPTVKLGQLTRIPVTALEEFVARRLAEGRRDPEVVWWKELDR